MSHQNNRLWIGGAAFLAIVILLGTYFLAAKPRLDSAAEMDDERVSVEARNTTLRREVSVLKEQEANLPETRTAIAGLQIGIPTTAKLDEFTKYIGELAVEHSVVIASVAVQPLAPIDTELPAVPTPTATAESSDAPVAGPGTAEQPAAAATTSLLDGFSSMPINIVLSGTNDNCKLFLDALQTLSTRHFLVDGLSILAVLVDTPAAQGLPELAAGDVAFTVSGSAFVLEGAVQPEDPAAVAPAPLPLPVPAPGANPFVPFMGTGQ